MRRRLPHEYTGVGPDPVALGSAPADLAFCPACEAHLQAQLRDAAGYKRIAFDRQRNKFEQIRWGNARQGQSFASVLDSPTSHTVDARPANCAAGQHYFVFDMELTDADGLIFTNIFNDRDAAGSFPSVHRQIAEELRFRDLRVRITSPDGTSRIRAIDLASAAANGTVESFYGTDGTLGQDNHWHHGFLYRAVVNFDDEVEVTVEQSVCSDVHLTLRSRLESGAALFRKLRRAGFPKIFTAALMAEYGVTIARDVDRGDPVGLERLRILATASCDGQLLIDAIAEVGAPDKLKQLKVLDSAGQEAALKVLEAWLLDEGTLVLTVPDASLSAWQDRSQEYGFGVSASVPDTDPIRLLAREYPGGRLDWQHFDFLSGPEKYRPLNTQKLRVLATPLQFAGQPALRWWEMEEGEAYFGDLAGGEADLARSVLAAYAAVAGDDWFVLPCRVPAGSLSRVSSMRVLDNFGDWTTIRSTAAGDAADGDRVWKWFEITGNPDKDPGTAPLLFVPPVVNTTREGDVLEEVHFRRDEMANLAWAIETRYQGVWDRAVERTAPIVKPEPTPENPEDWTYQLGSEVPANWFPLVPVRIIGDSPQVVFRRGRMAHDPSKRQRSVPRGVLLLPGEPFLLDEAEVPLAGTRVTRRYQMARSADGGTHLWNARRKTPSSGPMSHSPLDYDALKGWPAAKGRR